MLRRLAGEQRRSHASVLHAARSVSSRDCFWADQALKLKVTRFAFAAVIALNLKPISSHICGGLAPTNNKKKKGKKQMVQQAVKWSICANANEAVQKRRRSLFPRLPCASWCGRAYENIKERIPPEGRSISDNKRLREVRLCSHFRRFQPRVQPPLCHAGSAHAFIFTSYQTLDFHHKENNATSSNLFKRLTQKQ